MTEVALAGLVPGCFSGRLMKQRIFSLSNLLCVLLVPVLLVETDKLLWKPKPNVL